MEKSYRLVRYVRIEDRCVKCNVCESIVGCPSTNDCVGCSSCYLACPYNAIEPQQYVSNEETKIYIDGEQFFVPAKATLKIALKLLGFRFSRFPGEPNTIYTPCETGGCYACAVVVDGELRPLCHTAVREGMHISFDREALKPLRIIEGYIPHTVGGVGTPWWIKGSGYIEVACFAAGCNLRCPTCQNFMVTYNSKLEPMTPEKAALMLSVVRRKYGVDRMAISGGEPTLNRRWLIRFFRELRSRNKDSNARFHLDTNATLLTKDYIDELINVGVTDIGPDLKAYTLETFQKVTGIIDCLLYTSPSPRDRG